MNTVIKSQEREELHRTIWGIANELRGAVDGWDFKQYVLGTLFYRYISENLCSYVNKGEREAGDKDFDYALLTNEKAEVLREELIDEKGFFILPSQLFCNVQAKAKEDADLNETLQNVFRSIESSAVGSDSENDMVGLFSDFNANDNKLGTTVAERNGRLVKILDGVAEMKLGEFGEQNIDVFGDAYEFLMSMYASEAGKSGGEFFTPSEVSVLLTRLGTVGRSSVNRVYDPACGSGSLLLKAEQVLGKDKVLDGFFGQEINLTTYNLCRINMFLHDVPFDKFDIRHGDTLTDPKHKKDEPFDLIVSNPPYSKKWKGIDDPILVSDARFSPAGVLAPKDYSDMAFIMHCVSWLDAGGTAAIVCYPGIMYRGKAEQKIRQYLVSNNFVDCVIQLPSNLFFGTSISTSIMVLKKNKQDSKILFVDASKEYVKVINNNKLTPENIDRIVTTFAGRKEIPHFSHLASYDEVKGNKFNLSVSSYVEPEDTREPVDIVALNSELERIVAHADALRADIKNIIAEIEG